MGELVYHEEVMKELQAEVYFLHVSIGRELLAVTPLSNSCAAEYGPASNAVQSREGGRRENTLRFASRQHRSGSDVY